MKRILFVEDNAQMRYFYEALLSSKDDRWEVATAASGEEALKLMEACPFDVVASDMRMEGMNGVELLNRVQRAYPQTSRIIISGAADQAKAAEKAVLDAEDPKYDADILPLAVKARQAFPEDPYVAKSLGMIVCRQGDYTRAASLLKESARQLNHDPEVFYYLGLAQFHLNNAPEAKSDLQRALSLDLSGKDAANARRILEESE